MARIAKHHLISSDAAILGFLGQRAKGNATKVRRLGDGNGLSLVDIEGAKPGWRFEYRALCPDALKMKPYMLSLGTYPNVRLAQARELAQALRDQIAAGKNPAEERKAARMAQEAAAKQAAEDQERIGQGKAPAGSFEDVAVSLHDEMVRNGAWGERHAEDFLRIIRRNFKAICFTRMARITEADLKACLDAYTAQGKHNTAKDMLEFARQIYKHARKTGPKLHNIAAELSEDGYVTRPQVKSHPLIKDRSRLGELVNAARAHMEKSPKKAVALLLQIMLFQRSTNTAEMRWADLDAGLTEWRIPADQIKLRKAQQGRFEFHTVPLPKQARRLLWTLRAERGNSEYVFTLDDGTGHICRRALLDTLRTLGFSADEITPHGLRATAQTAINNMTGGALNSAIEANLAHVYGGNLGATYNQADYVEQRREMLQTWADHLDALADGTWAKAEAERIAAQEAALAAEMAGVVRPLVRAA